MAPTNVASTRPCPVCESGASLAFHHPDADLYRCADCDHCFSDIESMRSAEPYDARYYEQTHRNWFEHPHVWLFERIRQCIGAVGPAPTVLDVGCGRGDFLRWLHEKEPTWELTGIDLSPNDPQPGITLRQGDVFSMDTRCQFDVVMNLAVIEHVADVRRFIGVLRERCRPGGMVIVMTINDRSTLYAAARLLRRVGLTAAFDRVYERHHLNHFNVGSLGKLLALGGLRAERTILHNTPMDAVDMPAANRFVTVVRRAGVCGVFMLGALSGRTFLQTIVCRVPDSPASI